MSLNTPVVLLGALCIFGGLLNVKGSYEQEGLNEHNKYRKIHDAPPMRLDSRMTQQATAYAQRLARMGNLQHSSSSERPGQGENLAMACGSGGLSAQRAVEMWYKEVCQFNFNNPGWGYGTGHFTQIVWKDSVELGIGKADSGRCTYVVGRYRPAGNMMSDFKNNVAKGSFNRGYCSGGGGGGNGGGGGGGGGNGGNGGGGGGGNGGNGGGGGGNGGGGGGGGWIPGGGGGGGGGWRPGGGGGGGGGWRPGGGGGGGGGWGGGGNGGGWGRRRR